MYKDLKIELLEHLDNNENLIWVGKPKTGVVFRTSDIFLIPFSMLWCGFAIFWISSAISLGAPLLFSLFGVPFVVVGLYFVFGRFLVEAKQRENTLYGLTEERIIIKSGIFNKSIKSMHIKTLSNIEISEKNDGSGTISIGPKNPMMIWGNGMNWWPGMEPNLQLDLIPDVRKVYHQIIELQKIKWKNM